MASFVERNVRIDSIKLKDVVEKKTKPHLENRRHTIEGDVWENISDVNRVAPG